jgi:ATP-dependent RNA helicase SUPV3L1/SUV3
VLAADGALRWTGDLVGKLTAGDDTLRPRIRVIADEQLTGPARELVQTRLDLWLKTHIEKLLAPLFSLTAAEDVTGMARGVAFQLVEALGVLERQKVAEEVKGLDQPARATLRKYGVRFGAYHIYLPALLKPAPRALATQLWAIKQESPDAKGVGDLLHLAASGRTSIPVDKETPKTLYRTAGYRICGERAVRVDILERLADLIRPAMSWREGAPGPKPDGVYDGRSFLVTGAMTSLTGASGEDFASILRSLGYRMDRKPKPAETAASAPADATGAAAANDAAAVSTEMAPAEPAATDVAPAPSTPDEIPAAADLTSRSLLPEPELVVHDASPAQEPVVVAPAEAEIAPPAEPAPAVAADATQTAAETGPSEEQAFIEVWRPAGRTERRPHRPRRPQRAQQPQAPASGEAGSEVAAAPAEVAAAPASDAATPSRGPRRHEGGDRPDREKRQDRHERQQRMERQGQRGERQDRNVRRGPRRDRGEGIGRAERDQYFAKPHGSDRRDKQPDPNSPFAKLAALKQQLEQGSKEPT